MRLLLLAAMPVVFFDGNAPNLEHWLTIEPAVQAALECRQTLPATTLLRILVKLATNNASKLAGDNASTCPLQKELQAES